MGNRKLLFAAAAFFAFGGLAAAFNPQPDPPGRHLTTVNPNAQFEPPDPCLANQHTLMVRKAGGTQMEAKPLACAKRGTNPNLHPLNPQPLPPG